MRTVDVLTNLLAAATANHLGGAEFNAATNAARQTIVDLQSSKALCPECGDAMVRCHIEYHDKSGWHHGWSCANCDREDADFTGGEP